jgi:dihydrodipicolinate synthase/N-acetylneuraminate lyase
MSGAVSVGANLVPEAWHKVTQSSLQLLGDQEKYPDHLEQVWELGRYLQSLKDIYRQAPVAIIKAILADIGVIETTTCTVPSVNVEEPKRKIKEIMSQYGDYPEAE